MDEPKPSVAYLDENRESVGAIIRRRIPWLFVGLGGGILASLLVSRFEEIISKNIALAFFLPFIVYISDAVGTQSETLFIRSLARGRVHFGKFLLKEFIFGITTGLTFGIIVGGVTSLWVDRAIAYTVGLAMAINISIAPIVALTIPEILFKNRSDPALGGGPFSTIVEDIVSLSVYLVVASVVLF